MTSSAALRTQLDEALAALEADRDCLRVIADDWYCVENMGGQSEDCWEKYVGDPEPDWCQRCLALVRLAADAAEAGL